MHFELKMNLSHVLWAKYDLMAYVATERSRLKMIQAQDVGYFLDIISLWLSELIWIYTWAN